MDDEMFYEQSAEQLLHLIHNTKRRPLQQDIHKMRGGELGMLLYLSGQTSSVSAGKISRDLQIGSGGVANMLNILEKKGYIRRDMSQSDRRSVVVTISESGLALIEERKRDVRQAAAGILRELGEEDTRELLRIFSRLMEISDRWMDHHIAEIEGEKD